MNPQDPNKAQEPISAPQLIGRFRAIASAQWRLARAYGLDACSPRLQASVPNVVDFIRFVQANRDFIGHIRYSQETGCLYARLALQEPFSARFEIIIGSSVD